ncbi:MAG: glycoside hydrolase family 43 protein [Clostridia bacterium]|nr:glycoside hydrolase family 43 protein [Clostridia bacterium]
MKLRFEDMYSEKADPFIFEDEGRLYIYVTGHLGVKAFSGDDLFGLFEDEGIVFSMENRVEFWAPSVIRLGDTYYMYVSCNPLDEFEEYMLVAEAKSPLGPFTFKKQLYDRFSIDSHAVQNENGLFLFYAENNDEGERIGTRVFVDRLLSPDTPANLCRELIVPTIDEEIFKYKEGETRQWHTIEGPFYFKEGDYHYLMYSGGCYQNDTYHIGYAVAKTTESDLTNITFEKITGKDGVFNPVLFQTETEEGVGHHSVIKWKGEYYAIYHGRDRKEGAERIARICRLLVKDGTITAEEI